MTWAIIPLTLARFMLLTIVFMYFRHYHQYFTRFTVMGRSLQYIGRRTLDIYLIHYLFMPNLPTLGSFFSQYRHNFILDTTVSVFLALLVIGFSIITSNILRVSPFFKKWLFGREK
jgi:surface polysaccharide O-acyltransferase-like enzyme